MKTIEVKLYKFSELNEEAQQVAVAKNQENQHYFSQGENSASLKAFENMCNLRSTDYSYGGQTYATARTGQIDDDILQLKGKRLLSYVWNNYSEIFSRKYLNHGELREERRNGYHRMRKTRTIESGPNAGKSSSSYYSNIQLDTLNCPFTGYYMDNEILFPMYQLWEKFDAEKTLEELLQECIKSWVDACENDYQHTMSEEYSREELESNGEENYYTEDGEKY